MTVLRQRVRTATRSRRARVTAVAGAAVVAALTLYLSRYLSPHHLALLSQVLIFGLLAMSLNLLMGYAGLPSLGHAAPFGVGAYVVAIMHHGGMPSVWSQTLLGVVAGAVVAAVFGLLALRTRGTFFLIITLALAQTVWALAWGWRSVTNGDDGLAGIPRPSFFGGALSVWSSYGFFLFTLVVVAAAMAALYVFTKSPFGLAIRGIRENEPRMAALGYNVWLYKYVAFVVSGAFAGLAGVLFVYFNGFVNVALLSVKTSAEALVMAILGGSATFLGPLVGAGIIVLGQNAITSWIDRWPLVLGLVYMTIVVFAPAGVVGTLGGRRRRVLLERGE